MTTLYGNLRPLECTTLFPGCSRGGEASLLRLQQEVRPLVLQREEEGGGGGGGPCPHDKDHVSGLPTAQPGLSENQWGNFPRLRCPRYRPDHLDPGRVSLQGLQHRQQSDEGDRRHWRSRQRPHLPHLPLRQPRQYRPLQVRQLRLRPAAGGVRGEGNGPGEECQPRQYR